MYEKKSGRQLAFAALAVLLLVAADQLTKWAAYTYLRVTQGVSVISGVFELRYLENTSAAFSLDPVSILHKIFHFTYFDEYPDAFLTARLTFLIVLTLAVLVLIVLLYRRLPSTRRFLPLNLILIGIFAGAAGNLIDRFLHRFVIDFLYFSLIDFPVFNVADIYVTVSAAALAVAVLFYYKEDDFSVIFPEKRKKAAGGKDCAK